MLDEIKNNYATFQSGWLADLTARISDLPSRKTIFEQSYIRLTSLQAWRSIVIEPNLKPASAGFFVEAQNDALISHVQAALGSWRVALKALRSCLENTLLCLYYMDHAIELILWGQGTFRISVSEAINYFQKHPSIIVLPQSLTGLDLVTRQYKQLSKAVHASSVDFRMTEAGTSPALWKTEKKHEGIWAAHERNTIQSINLLLLALFKDHLQGTRNGALREALGRAVPKTKDAAIKQKLKVAIKR